MAYVSAETKAKILAGLKEVMPEGWKYSLSIRDLVEARLLISKAPIDLAAMCNANRTEPRDYAELHPGRIESIFTGDVLETMKKIRAALNVDNHDNTDSMRGYVDVGYYVRIELGRDGSPFVVKPLKK
jgi:hypothetical protein